MRFIFTFLIALLISFNNEAKDLKRSVHETLISNTGSFDIINNTYYISNNLRSIAFRIRKGDKIIAVIDTLQGNPYDDVSTPVFSTDGSRFAYAAKESERWNIIADNKREVSFEPGTVPVFLTFSTDNKKMLYIIHDAKHSYLVYNKIKSAAFDGINENSVTFSNKGKLAYSATLHEKQFNIVDGQKGLVYDKVGFPLFSPDGKQCAYWVLAGNKYFIILDNNKRGPYDFVGNISFSPDSKHFHYDVKRNGKHFVVLDGIPREKFNELTYYALSPDGTKLAYAISLNDQEFTAYVVWNGRKEGPYEQVMPRSLVFSPDGNELVYGAQLPLHEEINGVKKEIDAYEWFIVKHGKEGIRYNLLQGSLVFSPDGQHLAFGAEKYVQRVVNLDGKEQAPYDDIYTVEFSKDSKQLVYTAKLNNKEFVVVNGDNGKMYDELPGQKTFLFDSNNSFHYLAKKGNKIYLVVENIE
ncbi:MAG: hypothetical protein JWN78_549 [Bacteroidota bacterium]|nr:hypothetical protein [Bacteroidota bacterium]